MRTLLDMLAKGPARTWLVTGCSAGLGREFVSAIVARGDRVIATARNLTSLDEFSGQDSVKSLQLDVTASQRELDDKVSEAVSFFGEIDVLVNNAGYVGSGVWEEVK
jgi:NAD(P)-dependent dehydrogenase (short-subunit alcohol dehydrogenase family)